MTTVPKLEAYLSALDKALGALSISERAEIITEIKSHILEAQNRDPEKSLENILASLGPAEQVASRYLVEKGLPPAKPSSHTVWVPIVKWLSIGAIGCFAIAALVFMVLIWKFSPLMTVDDKSDHVTFLGGLVDINGNDHGANHMEGKKKIEDAKNFTIRIPMSNGRFNFENSSDGQLTWDCRTTANAEQALHSETHGLTLDFSHHSAKCEFKIPKEVQVEVEGANGRMTVEKPHYHIKMVLANGKIGIAPDKNTDYKFATHVNNGQVDNFDSSEKVGAYRIDISLGNGKISNEI